MIRYPDKKIISIIVEELYNIALFIYKAMLNWMFSFLKIVVTHSKNVAVMAEDRV